MNRRFPLEAAYDTRMQSDKENGVLPQSLQRISLPVKILVILYLSSEGMIYCSGTKRKLESIADKLFLKRDGYRPFKQDSILQLLSHR
jgi:hypothetical protein